MMNDDLVGLFIGSILNSKEDELSEDWEVTCQNIDCGWKGVISECSIEIEQETPEMPQYKIALCPKCGEPIHE